MSEGFKIKKRGKCTICSDCSRKVSIYNKLKSQAESDNNEVTDLGSGNYAPELCLICKDSITRKGDVTLDMPEQIATLLDKKFENIGDRFGGVNPIVDTESSREKVDDGVVKSDSLKTQYDPVIVELRPYEKYIYDRVVRLLDKLSHMSNIRYNTKTIEDEDGEVAIHEITAFAVS